MAGASILPCVDLQYTPKRKHFKDESADMLRQIMQTSKPMIVVWSEKNAAGILLGDFVSHWNRPLAFAEYVGSPEIHYYTHRGKICHAGNSAEKAEHEVNPKDCYMLILPFHRGADKYLGDATELRRLTDVGVWPTPLVLDIMQDLLQTERLSTRQSLSKAFLERFVQRWEISGSRKALVEAKED